jgi:3-phosphoshikimate 1-carboxyvinyltransferase
MTPPVVAIVPKLRPTTGIVELPGSKSITNRALLIATLAGGPSRLINPLDADDTIVMRDCLRALGAEIDDTQREWIVKGTAGSLHAPESALWVGGSGTTARFLTAVAPLAGVDVLIDGEERMRSRPMAGLVRALRQLGAEIVGEALPLVVRGGGLAGGVVEVPTAETSQFVSAMLMVGPLASGPLEVRPTGEFPSKAYAASTIELMVLFGADIEAKAAGWRVQGAYTGHELVVEGDASAAVYPWVAAAITGGKVTVKGLGSRSSQPDLAVAGVLESMGCGVESHEDLITLTGPAGPLRPIESDLSAMPDGALAVAVACLFGSGPSRLSGLGSLEWKESDRGRALAAELTKVGATVRFEEGLLVIEPGGELRPAVLDSHGDHRLAMAFSLLGLAVEGIAVTEPECVSKTWPGYFEMLASL